MGNPQVGTLSSNQSVALNIRESQVLTAPVIGKIPVYGVKGTVSETQGEWTKISVPPITGWVWSAYLDFVPDPTPEPTPEPSSGDYELRLILTNVSEEQAEEVRLALHNLINVALNWGAALSKATFQIETRKV